MTAADLSDLSDLFVVIFIIAASATGYVLIGFVLLSRMSDDERYDAVVDAIDWRFAWLCLLLWPLACPWLWWRVRRAA